MSNEIRITNAYALSYALENLPDAPAGVREKWEKMLESATRKRSSGERKPTSKQVANAAIKENIVAFLSEQSEPVKAADIMANVDGLSSVPHLSALLAQLRASKQVKREYDKKTPIYSLGAEED